MSRLPEKDYTYFTTVRGMCRSCRALVPARVVFRHSQVWQQALCANCGTSTALIAADVEWYLNRMKEPRLDHSPLPGSFYPDGQPHGCPHDCGPCPQHASGCQLPVISITNACNLRCPICFTYNRPDELYFRPVEEIRKTVDDLIERTGRCDLLNITGGEPTLHPELLEVLRACRRPEIGRITLNSNGINLASDEGLCERLAELDVCVILSFNTHRSDLSARLHGRDLVETKLRAIENLTRAGVRMTLLTVLVRGQNEEDLPRILDLLRSNPQILSLTIQTMTYTGQGGGNFPRAVHIPVDEAARIVCRALEGEINEVDFFSRPTAHPLCYSLCYLFLIDGRFLPFTRLLPSGEVQAGLRDSYLFRVPDDEAFFRDLVNRAYAAGQSEYLAALKQFVKRLFPPGQALSDFERQRIAESAVRTIYLHAHMDEDTFDCSRAVLCPDLVPVESGRVIPACTYNLFYRQKDPRFYV